MREADTPGSPLSAVALETGLSQELSGALLGCCARAPCMPVILARGQGVPVSAALW